MSHSERIQEAAKEIEQTIEEGMIVVYNSGNSELTINAKEVIAAIISKHIPEQNALPNPPDGLLVDPVYMEKMESIVGELAKLEYLGGKVLRMNEVIDLIQRARSLATPSEPLGVTKPLGVEPVPTISSNAGVPIRPQEE